MAERILVVEDSPTQSESLRILLVEAGYGVATARSAEAALDQLQGSERFDVILSDIVMPGMSGYDLCRAAKRLLNEACPPIILLTTLSDATDIVRGLECGADNYVTKPYDPAQLLQKIRQVQSNRALRRFASGSDEVEVDFMGETFSISAEKEQILDMLLSSFEELVRTADELRRSRSQLAALHARAEDRADRLTRLQLVTEALSRASTAVDVLRVVVTTAREVLEADAGVAGLLGEGGELTIADGVGYSAEVMERWATIPLDADLPIAAAVRRGEPVVIATRAEMVKEYGPIDNAIHEALLAAPFVVGEETLGAWAISFARARQFDELDRLFFETLTRQCAQALDRARLYEAERQARAEAEEANRAKAQFLASMSHDLRTPLNAIGGYVELIELGIRGPVTDAQKTDLARIKKSQEFLLALINDVLNFAKLEAGTVVYDIKSVPVLSILRDVDLMVRPQMESKGLLYSWTSCEPDLHIEVDREKLQQAMLNLAGNALKFTRAGGTISISCRSIRERVELIVQDSGIGIAPEKLDSIFDPFVQVHRRVEDSGDGIGLGLAISRDLVRGMGGELRVESEVGKGSTFVITVPQKVAEAGGG